MLTISRLCNPSSELFIAEHYYQSTAMPELLGLPVEKINEQRLYRALDKLLPHKEALEKHLKKAPPQHLWVASGGEFPKE